MSKFVCGLSGEPIEEAVVSQVSGTVFEKRLIHKWIQENGTDPGKIDWRKNKFYYIRTVWHKITIYFSD